ncbi:MAG: helix-turn-helix domain-containing protein [Tepidisphaeraceae bacterium]|jgi:excisionase family DNA binding protein
MSETTIQPLLVSAEDAARLLSISKRSLWRLVSQGRVHRVKFSKRLVRFRTDEISALVSSQREGTPA